jgi:hypothetical protein
VGADYQNKWTPSKIVECWPPKKLIWAVNKILLSNPLGRKLNTLQETKKLGSESNHFEQILGRIYFSFEQLLGQRIIHL